jgi:hypothetical protein
MCDFEVGNKTTPNKRPFERQWTTTNGDTLYRFWFSTNTAGPKQYITGKKEKGYEGFPVDIHHEMISSYMQNVSHNYERETKNLLIKNPSRGLQITTKERN